MEGVSEMDSKDIQFIELMEECKREIKNNLVNQTEKNRFNRIIKELEDLQDAVKNKVLVSDFYYLHVTQMIERDDPEKIIKKVLEVNNYYCKFYQQL